MAQQSDKAASAINVGSKIRLRKWLMSPEALETFKSFCEIAGVVVLFLAFVFGAGALLMANRIGAIKDKELNDLKLETAHANEGAGQANERAAKLEVDAARLRLQLEQEIQKHAQRILTDSQKEILASELKGKVSKVAFVVQRDQESRAFALQLEIIFQHAGAELNVYAMPAGDVPPAFFGVVMYKPGGITDKKGLKDDPVYKALKGANLFSGTAAKPFTSFDGIKEPPLLPIADRYVLYISQKPPW